MVRSPSTNTSAGPTANHASPRAMIRRCGWRRWATTSRDAVEAQRDGGRQRHDRRRQHEQHRHEDELGRDRVAAAGLEVEPAEDDGGEHEQDEVGDRHLLAVEPEREQQPGGDEEQGDQQLRAELARLHRLRAALAGLLGDLGRTCSRQASPTRRFPVHTRAEAWLSRRGAPLSRQWGEFARKPNVSRCAVESRNAISSRKARVHAVRSPSSSGYRRRRPHHARARRPRGGLRRAVRSRRGAEDVPPVARCRGLLGDRGRPRKRRVLGPGNGGAAVVAGNEPFLVGGADDDASLKLPASGSATTSPMCVGSSTSRCASSPRARCSGRSRSTRWSTGTRSRSAPWSAGAGRPRCRCRSCSTRCRCWSRPTCRSASPRCWGSSWSVDDVYGSVPDQLRKWGSRIRTCEG